MLTANWSRTTEPTAWPISLDDAKAQARVTHSDEDGLFAGYIATAVAMAEDYLGRGLLTQTWTLTLDDWSNRIWLPMAAPLQSITSVKYYDASGTLQTLSSTYYGTDSSARPACLVKAPNQTWPALQADRRSWRVEVVYVVGWSTAASVPDRIKQGIRLMVTALDANRDGTDASGDVARRAAEQCWADRIFVPPVERWL